MFLFRLNHFRINNHVLTLSLVAGSFKYHRHHHHHHHHHHHSGSLWKTLSTGNFSLCCICQNIEFCKVEHYDSNMLTLISFLCLFVEQTYVFQCCTLFYSTGRTRKLLWILDSALYMVRWIHHQLSFAGGGVGAVDVKASDSLSLLSFISALHVRSVTLWI